MSKKHTHRYESIDGVWYCAKPDCNHYMPKNIRNGSVEGKMSECWNCHRDFRLTGGLMKKDKPICMTCVNLEDAPEKERELRAKFNTNLSLDEMNAIIEAQLKNIEKAKTNQD